MKEFEEKKLQEESKKEEVTSTPKKLSIRDLLAIRGGFDSDENLLDCTSGQCYAAATVCVSNMI